MYKHMEVCSVDKEHFCVGNVHVLVSTEIREAVNSVSSRRPVFITELVVDRVWLFLCYWLLTLIY